MPADYKLGDNGTIIRTSDGACIPPVTANSDYATYLDWLAESGNEPDPQYTEEEIAQNDANEKKAAVAATDNDFVRVSEDLIDTLIEKEVIALSDLPEAAQTKYNNRKTLRDQIPSGY